MGTNKSYDLVVTLDNDHLKQINTVVDQLKHGTKIKF
jgi:hypothetical protein